MCVTDPVRPASGPGRLSTNTKSPQPRQYTASPRDSFFGFRATALSRHTASPGEDRGPALARQWAVPSSLERRRRTRVWGFRVSTFESATLVRELTIRRCRKCTRYVAAPNLASSALPLSVHQRSLRTHYYHSLRHACLHVFLAHERVPVLHFSSPLHWQLGAGNGRGRCRLPDWWPHLSERGVRCVPV